MSNNEVGKMMNTANAGVLSAENLSSGVTRAVPGAKTGAELDKASKLSKKKPKTRKK